MNPKNQISRIIKILELFSMGHRLSCNDIREHFDREVSLRTIQRDIAAIQEAEIPLRRSRNLGKEICWFFPSNYRKMVLPNIQPGEMLALYILKAYLKTFRGTSIEQDIGSLLEKIENLSPGDVYLDFEEQQDLIWDQDTGQYDYQDFGTLLKDIIDFILHKTWVTVTYKSLGEKAAKVYDVFIYHLFHYHGSIYLVAYTPEHDNFITLALHRLEKIVASANKWGAAPALEIAQFRQQRFGVFGGQPCSVSLQINQAFTPYFVNRSWHPSQRSEIQPDGSLRLEMDAPLSPELISWILSWHEAIRVLEPPLLIEKIKTRLNKTLEQY